MNRFGKNTVIFYLDTGKLKIRPVRKLKMTVIPDVTPQL